MIFRLKKITLLFSSLTLYLLISINSCQSNNVEPTGIKEDDSNWNTSLPEEQHLNSSILQKLEGEVRLGKFGKIKSLLIARNDYLVFEKYFNGADRNQLHIMYSITKSITSVITGIALNVKKNFSVNERIKKYFPAYSAGFDSIKGNITIKELLNMSAGFQWNELSIPYSNPDNDFNKLFSSNDEINYILNKPVANTPGTKFTYNTGLPILQSVILQMNIDMTVPDFTNKYLFIPLGISSWEWDSFRDNITNTGNGLSLRPIDMALIGQLFLNKGYWNKKQIIMQDWVDESSKKEISVNADYDYGYYWWKFSNQNQIVGSLPVNDLYFAWGYSDQFLFIIPVYNMVLVITADNQENNYPVFNILKDYVFKALEN